MPLKDSGFLEDDDVPFPEVGYVVFWGIKYQSKIRYTGLCHAQKCKMQYNIYICIYIYIQLKLWKSCRRLSHSGGVFHVSVIGSCFVHFKVLRILWVLQFPSSACFYLKCCVSYRFCVLFEIFFMIFLHQVDIQFHCPVSFC